MRRIDIRASARRAAAAVEMALVLPLLMVVVFGIIEFGWTLSVQNTLVHAAREGARVGALQGYDTADMEEKVNEQLTPLGLASKVSKTFTEATTDDPMVGVELEVPRQVISLLGTFFGIDFGQGTLRARCWMRKEGV